MTVIMRSFMDSCKDLFTPESRQRAKEYLLSAGYRVEGLQPMVWPEDAVSAHRDHAGQPWKFTTKADIRHQRQEDAKEWLQIIREDGVVRRVPLYVWVFWCPGIPNFFDAFRGWWTYIIGNGVEHGGKYLSDTDLILRAMELFPVIDPKLFNTKQDWEERERWMIEFAKRYRRGTWCGKPQGKAPVWGEVEGGQVKSILGRAKWPVNRKCVH